MKNKIIQISLLLGFVFGLAGFAQAQSASEYCVNIPFDFTVGKKLFRAGDYSVTFAGLKGRRDRLVIQSKTGKDAALLVVRPKQSTLEREELNNSILVFNRYENQY